MICKSAHTILPPSLPFIPLGKGLSVIVDQELSHDLQRYRWFAKRSKSTWYAVRRIRRLGKDRLIRMHRQITNCPPLKQVHHMNGNGLDNRRMNLLVCTPWEHKQIQQFTGHHPAESNVPRPQPNPNAATPSEPASTSGITP